MKKTRTSSIALAGLAPLLGLAASLLIALATRGFTLLLGPAHLHISPWEWSSTLTLAALGAPVAIDHHAGFAVNAGGTAYGPPLLLTLLIALACYLPARLSRHWEATHALMSGLSLAGGAGLIWLMRTGVEPNPFLGAAGALIIGSLASLLGALSRTRFGYAWRWTWGYAIALGIPIAILGAIAGASYLELPGDSLIPWTPNIGLTGWMASLGGFSHAELSMPSLFGTSIPMSFGPLAGAAPGPLITIVVIASLAGLALFATAWSTRASLTPRWALPLAFAILAGITTIGGMFLFGQVRGGAETITLTAHFVPSPVNIPIAAAVGFVADTWGKTLAKRGIARNS